MRPEPPPVLEQRPQFLTAAQAGPCAGAPLATAQLDLPTVSCARPVTDPQASNHDSFGGIWDKTPKSKPDQGLGESHGV